MQRINDKEIFYTMPDESSIHEGTWLQWPHHYQYGITYRNSLDSTWIAMTKELIQSEKLHIVAYDEIEKTRIINLLKQNSILTSDIDFLIQKTDDVWARDNGPIYVKDSTGNLVILDWGFNGWGKKNNESVPIQYNNCNKIPTAIAFYQNIPSVNLQNVMVAEGGAFEVDGEGTFMATKSSVLNKNRNPKLNQIQAEEILKKFLGITNFIWLEGREGLDVTDQHIDGFARFGNNSTIVTMNESDLLEWQVKQTDINKLYNAKNKDGVPYTFLKVPLTKFNVKTTNGKDLGYQGSYVNYYTANTVVLVPNYNDPNDEIANSIIQSIYPTRKVIGIDVRNLYEHGGMIHCVTQQQPK
jgi:agmatine deiminase